MHKNIKLIDSALIKLGIGIKDGEKTSPKEMLEFMHKIDLDIEDIIAKTQSSLLKKLVTEEISLGPLKERILIGIANNPPMAQSFIEVAKSQESINVKLTEEQRSCFIHLLVILEVLTTLMLNDVKLQEIIVISLFKKRKSINYGSSFWNFYSFFKIEMRDIFRSLKAISVDPSLFVDLCWRKYFPTPSEDNIKQFIKEHNLTGLNKSFLRKALNKKVKKSDYYNALSGNIFEALMAEEITINRRQNCKKYFFLKFNDATVKTTANIQSGLALILFYEFFEEQFLPLHYLPKNVKSPAFMSTHIKHAFWYKLYNFSTNNNSVKTTLGITQEWVNLYESWDLAFVLRYFPKEFHLLVPKLLIPQSLLSVPENYLAGRVISLWLSINFANNLRRNRLQTKFTPVDHNFLIECLGKNNLDYGQNELLKSEKIDLNDYYKNHIQSKSTWCLYFKALQMLRGARLMPDKENKK